MVMSEIPHIILWYAADTAACLDKDRNIFRITAQERIENLSKNYEVMLLLMKDCPADMTGTVPPIAGFHLLLYPAAPILLSAPRQSVSRRTTLKAVR